MSGFVPGRGDFDDDEWEVIREGEQKAFSIQLRQFKYALSREFYEWRTNFKAEWAIKMKIKEEYENVD